MVTFEWDEKKNRLNSIKHGVSFEEATLIWNDPLSIEFQDNLSLVNETRYLRIGLNPVRGVLVVVFCEREYEMIRIISARKATSKERKDYEERI